MSTYSADRRVVARTFARDLRTPAGARPATLGLLTAWTGLLLPSLGVVAADFGSVSLLLMLAVWVVLAAARVLGRRDAGADLRVAAAWTTIVVAGIGSAVLIESSPVVALVPVPLVIAASACLRWPSQSVTALAVFSGWYGTLPLYTHVSVGPLTDLVLAGLWSGFLWRLLTTARRRAWRLWPGVALFLVFLFLTVLALRQADTLYIGLKNLRVWAWYATAFLLLAYGGWSVRTYDRMARGMVAVAFSVGAYALLRFVTGPTGAERELALSTAGGYNTVDGELRLFGSTAGGHDLAVWTVVALPLCLACAFHWSGRWRVIAGSAAGLAVFSAIATEVRAAIPGLVIGVVIVLVLHSLSPAFAGRKLGPGLALGGGVVAGAVAIFIALGVNGSSRYEGLLHPGSDASFQERTYKWRQALVDLRDHPLGYGPGSAGRVLQTDGRFTSAATLTIENGYLVIAYQLGSAMAVLMAVAMLAVLGHLMVRTATVTSRRRASYGMGAAASFAAFMVLMLNGPYIEGFPALWAWLVLGLGVGQFTTGDAEPA